MPIVGTSVNSKDLFGHWTVKHERFPIRWFFGNGRPRRTLCPKFIYVLARSLFKVCIPMVFSQCGIVLEGGGLGIPRFT